MNLPTCAINAVSYKPHFYLYRLIMHTRWWVVFLLLFSFFTPIPLLAANNINDNILHERR